VYEGAVQELIDELGRLPGIGPKSAQRIAFHILDADSEDMTRLAASIQLVKEKVKFCEICFNISEQERCAICRDERRDGTKICIVEESKDVMAIERTRAFGGKYHVLGGSINPLAGIGPEQLHIRELVTRLADESITELILATDPNLEGEATAVYLVRALAPLGIRITRLASGLPVGGDLEYADEVTLARAFEGRRTAGSNSAAARRNDAPTSAPARNDEAEEDKAPASSSAEPRLFRAVNPDQAPADEASRSSHPVVPPMDDHRSR